MVDFVSSSAARAGLRLTWPGIHQFDTNTKLVFNSVEDDYGIKFGFDRHTDKQAGIVRGRLTLTGYGLPLPPL